MSFVCCGKTYELAGIAALEKTPTEYVFAFLFEVPAQPSGIDRYKDMFENNDFGECEKCGDPECKDGEICGLKEDE